MVSINNRFNPLPEQFKKLDKNRAKNEQTPQEPNLNQMEGLYSLWCSSEIIHFPAGAYKNSIEKRTKNLEKYVKDNNLKVDVSNVEQFFNDVRNKMPNGKLASQRYVLTRLNDYIKNGYQQNVDLSDLSLRKHEISAEINKMLSSKKDELIEDYNNIMMQNAKINIALQDAQKVFSEEKEDTSAKVSNYLDGIENNKQMSAEDVLAEMAKIDSAIQDAKDIFSDEKEDNTAKGNNHLDDIENNKQMSTEDVLAEMAKIDIAMQDTNVKNIFTDEKNKNTASSKSHLNNRQINAEDIMKEIAKINGVKQNKNFFG